MVFHDDLKSSLKNYKLHLSYEIESDGTNVAILKEITDIYGIGSNRKEAFNNLENNLKEYAEEYFKFFYGAANRKEHLPYILRILLKEDIIKIINIK